MKNSDIWYLASTRPNQYHRAVINLERQGYGCFLPKCVKSTRIGRRIANKVSPLFPGYLFVKIAKDHPWRPVQATYGVRTLVMRAANTPQPVPDHIMSDLLSRTGPDGLVEPAAHLAPGDEVKVTAGPMVGFVARIERLQERDRVSVLIEMMGQAVRAELPRTHLLRNLV